MKNLDNLILQYAGEPLCSASLNNVQSANGLWKELLSILSIKNGFYAFESSLHFFSLGNECSGTELIEWNRRQTWKHYYEKLSLDNITCFAANVFGDQFCIDTNGIGRMDAETGEIEPIGESLEDWAMAIIDDPDYHLGFSLAHCWQEQNGDIKAGMRLVPIVPFICGGSFDIGNLRQMNMLESLHLRGSIATQLHDIPDGTAVQFDIGEKGSPIIGSGQTQKTPP